ncbi:MAG: hypothetical protein Q8S33_05040 [Myxococcales bacterium]|nr:hypothetical protein [Myxococcales bacterium]
MMPTLLLVLTAAPCVVTGDDFSTRAPVELRPEGGGPVMASLRGLSTRAVLEGKSALLTVERPLSFHATAKRLRLSVKTETTLFDGDVLLREGTEVQWREARGERVAGDVIVQPDGDELETEDKRPALTFAARAIPCAALTLDLTRTDPVKQPMKEGPVFSTDSLPLRVFPSPSSTTPSFTLSSTTGRTLYFRMLDKRGAMASVEYLNLYARTSLRGWVPLRALRALPPGEGWGEGSMCSGDHDSPMLFGRHASSGVPRHDGPLTLPPGTVLSIDCETKRAPERRCPVATVTSPLEAKVRWDGGPTADVSLHEVVLEPGALFSIDATTVTWPEAGAQGARSPAPNQ